MSNFKDTLSNDRARGVLTVNTTRKSTGEVTNFSEHNLVVQMSNNILAGLMGGDLGCIDRICLGNSPVTETLEDTTISLLDTDTLVMGDTQEAGVNIAFTQPMNSHEYLAPNIIQFNWEVGYNQANGIDIAEYGLCNTEGMMFSRKVRGRIEKTEDLALNGTWTIEFLPIEPIVL